MPRRRLRRIRRPQLALIVLLVALAIGYGVNALTHDGSSKAHVSSTVALSSLPVQAAQTITLIKKGGPYPYPRNDGVVFDNNEQLLPKHSPGYYHEYTVPTPGATTRGARRIITGQDGEYYYTGDHYEHFELIDLTR